MKKEINLFNRLTDPESVYHFQINKLDLSGYEECHLNTASIEFATPLALVLLAHQVRHLMARHPEVRFFAHHSNSSFRSYADHIGFFQYMGFDRGNPPGTSSGSSTYTPINVYNRHQIIAEADGRPLGLHCREIAVALANVLVREDNPELRQFFCYGIQEMLRNAFEHSESPTVSCFAQRWPQKGTSEIVIAGRGDGIAKSIFEIESVDCTTELEALKVSLLPGVSGVPRSVRATQDSDWGNSGFGLYVTSRLCGVSGSFRIISGDAGLTIENEKLVEHSWSFTGTCIQMCFQDEAASRAISRATEIIAEGEALASELRESSYVTASKASRIF